MNETSRNVSYLQTTVSDTTFKLSELQHYVDHFADNLVLSSSQITVDPAAGFASKAMNLTETLNMCNKNFNESEVRANEQGFVIEKILKELDTKAPDTVLFNINTLEKKVATIEMHLQKEEEQGIGAIRKACDELQVHVQTMQQELSEKIDRESVGFIVHEKYEEIVRYLQDALQSSLEDENNFKVKADEIQEMVIQLSNSKADRTEIANMQELMVKSEALLKKVGAQANVKERLKEFISKKEVDALLALKVDKSEFDFQLQNAAANNRRTRKASQQPGQMPVVDDAINKLPAIHPNNVNQSTPFMTDEVASDIIGNRVRLNNDSSTMHHSQSQKLPTPSGAIPVIAIGRSLSPPHSKQRATAGVQGDFGAMSKSHKGKSSKVSMSLPAATGPGAFRAASEAGQAGGWDKRAESPSEGGGGAAGGAAGADGYGRTEYPFVPPNYEMDYSQQAATTDHMAYLGAPVAGGGFNSKSQHLVHALPEGNSVPQADIEGEGMYVLCILFVCDGLLIRACLFFLFRRMLEGQDGKLYYQDLESP